MMTKTKADKYPQRVRNELRFRELTVLRVERAGAAFQRIVLGGEALEGFASHGFDDHTKLFFPEPGAAFTPPQVTEEGLTGARACGLRPGLYAAVRCRTSRAGLRFLYPRWRYCQPLGAGSKKWAISW